MQQSKSPFAYILATLFLLMCSLIAFGAYNDLRPQTIDPSRESIYMVEPCGWPWCKEYDAHYASEVNKPNSEANENNGKANFYNAQATKTVAEAEKAATEARIAQSNVGWNNLMGCLLGGSCVLLLVFLMTMVRGVVNYIE